MYNYIDPDSVKQDVKSLFLKTPLIANYGNTTPAEKIWANRLKNTLILKIKGEIKYHLIDDTLIVDIYSVNYMCYRYTINNLSCKIVTGYDVEMVAESICKGYKRFIMNLYFIEKVVDK